MTNRESDQSKRAVKGPKAAKPETTTNADAATAEPQPSAAPPRVTKGETLTQLMRADGGATAQALAEAVGWQVHSVRGFIAGTLKKRNDMVVTTARVDGVTRYSLADAA